MSRTALRACLLSLALLTAAAALAPPASAQGALPSDEEFLRQMDAQRKALQDRGANALELPTAPPKPAPPAAKGKAKPPEKPPTIDADLQAIAETEGMLAPDEGTQPTEPTKTVVFVSLSMPEADLKNLFAQGRGRADVLFVLRGWKPPAFVALAQKVKRLMMDAGGLDINVVIDPYPFRTYNVKQVPVFLHERSGGDWRRVTGAISLDRAIDEIERGNFNKTLGVTYRIAEPDIVEEIQKRADGFDWEKEKAKITARYETNMDGSKPLVTLPRVEVSREFFVDPSITVNEDVIGSDGKVAVPKGATVNPFSIMNFSKSFIAFDPSDAKQVLLAQRWTRERGPVMLLATHLPAPTKGKPTLAQMMGQSVYPLSPELVERFGIVAVPSFVQQQGLLLRINEQKP